jgi:hypothetical protein
VAVVTAGLTTVVVVAEVSAVETAARAGRITRRTCRATVLRAPPASGRMPLAVKQLLARVRRVAVTPVAAGITAAVEMVRAVAEMVHEAAAVEAAAVVAEAAVDLRAVPVRVVAVPAAANPAAATAVASRV